MVTASGAAAVATSTSPVCCPADCPLVVQSCAADAVTGVACSGHGRCLTGVGVCACFEGYAGDACDSCASNYVATTTTSGTLSSCVFLAGSASTCSNGVRDGVETGVDCGGVCLACVGAAAGSTPLSSGLQSTLSHRSVMFIAVAVCAAVVLGAAQYAGAEARRSSGQLRMRSGTHPEQRPLAQRHRQRAQQQPESCRRHRRRHHSGMSSSSREELRERQTRRSEQPSQPGSSGDPPHPASQRSEHPKSAHHDRSAW